MLKTEVTPPGAALLLHGLPYLSVLLYDSIADTLWYCSVNAAVSPKFNLKTVAFGATDLLTPGHLVNTSESFTCKKKKGLPNILYVTYPSGVTFSNVSSGRVALP